MPTPTLVVGAPCWIDLYSSDADRAKDFYGRLFGWTAEAAEPERVNPAQRRRIEQLFAQAARDRSKAFELKHELDRLGLFKEYEDRFLDLFTKPGPG